MDSNLPEESLTDTSTPVQEGPSSVQEVPAPTKLASGPGLVRKLLRGLPWAPIVTVLIPTGASVAYFGVFASDIYISESHFVVRSANKSSPSGMAALFQGTGLSRATDDAYTVHDYMRSRDAMTKVDAKVNLREAYGSKALDRLARFDGFHLDGSQEALFKYYQKMVVVDFDTTAGISSLLVHAFSSHDAARMNEELLELGESLVNALNERARKDTIDFAQGEVTRAEDKVRSTAQALSTYRSKNGVLDPEKQGVMQLQNLSRLQDELITTTVQLTQIRSISPDNPQLPALQQRLASIQGALATERSKVVGGQSSLADKAGDFERLELDKVFAEKQLATALSSLEQARADTQRKQLYLERIAEPSKPDVGLEPRRFRAVMATFLVGLLAWGILAMLIAGVREHRS